MDLRSRSESGAVGWYRSHWFRDPSSPLPFGPAVWSFHPTVAGGWFSILPRTSRRVQLPYRALHGRRQPGPEGTRHLLWTFVPFDTFQRSRSGHPGRCLPGTFHPQGLPTLSTACSLDCLVGLVSDRQRPWGWPFGAFSSSTVAGHSCPGPTRLPLPQTSLRRTDCSPKPTAWRPASGCFRRRIPCENAGCLARQTAGCSHGIFPSQGSHTSALIGLKSHLLPRACAQHRLPNVASRTSEYRSADDWFDHEGRTSLSGFCTLASLAFGLAHPRAMGSPCERPNVTVRPVSRLGAATAYRSCQGC